MLIMFFDARFNGWGVTLFDSLDTMWIMGLRGEFVDAVQSVKDLRFNATMAGFNSLSTSVS